MATANRLHLDFSLATNTERVAFIDEYLQRPEFVKRPPTEEELETIGNYILWGKDPVTGLNAKQAGIVDIETKHGTWDKSSNVESLEGLMEQPTFNEASLQSLSEGTAYCTKREVFSRKEALEKCPEFLRKTFTDLFHQIDELDLAICYYDLAHGRRKNPPRDTLLIKFTEKEKQELQQVADSWTQYTYLRKRHQLVEMRREQYTLRDSFVTQIMIPDTGCAQEPSPPPSIDAEIEVLPLGTYNSSLVASALFRPWENLHPGVVSEKELQLISDLIWKKKKYKPANNQMYIDFRELEHVYQLFQLFFDLETAANFAEIDSNLPALMRTLKFYTDMADLSELQREILDLKLKKEKNIDIADLVNKKWGKSYTANYISTIFRQRIIPKINEAAAYHELLAGNLFFEEEFKTCTCCKKVLLRDSNNFTRKARSKDGFTTRCKKCEKASRTKE